ncbi:MAG TPA: MazG nucleotide pyrophosphohydrolase domain-containing protein, partial [Planctomycetota bacterium]|nr:MazG nucleotide pyrophosphohydrolase domain-containing protein [Planctomycetota bacterium]
LFPMEVAEVREAALNGDRERVFEELGDCFMLLLLLLAKAQNGEPGAGPIDAAEALKRVGEKIISRHTWIFGDDKAASPEEVERLWEVNKRREKAGDKNSAAGGTSTGAATGPTPARGPSA